MAVQMANLGLLRIVLDQRGSRSSPQRGVACPSPRQAGPGSRMKNIPRRRRRSSDCSASQPAPKSPNPLRPLRLASGWGNHTTDPHLPLEILHCEQELRVHFRMLRGGLDRALLRLRRLLAAPQPAQLLCRPQRRPVQAQLAQLPHRARQLGALRH